MKDVDYNKEKKRIGKFLTKWQGPMGLRWWKVNVTWDRSYDKNHAAAITHMDAWKYLEAEITFFMPECAALNDADLEMVVVHELCHVLLSPMSMNMLEPETDYQKQLMEFNTSMVAKAMLWVWRDAEDAAKAKKK